MKTEVSCVEQDKKAVPTDDISHVCHRVPNPKPGSGTVQERGGLPDEVHQEAQQNGLSCWKRILEGPGRWLGS